MDDDELHDHVDRTLRGACQILADIKQAGACVREKSKESYGRLLDAHGLMTGTLNNALKRRNGEPGNTSEATSHRLLLLGSFVQGIDLCETAISEGLYVQAAALLKQELETISAIEEVKAGRRQDGKTPNVQMAPWSLNHLYGVLNDTAHVGKADTLHQLLGLCADGGAQPVGFTPQFREPVAVRQFSVHVALLTWACLELHWLQLELYGDGLTPAERETFERALNLLVAEGVLGRSDEG